MSKRLSFGRSRRARAGAAAAVTVALLSVLTAGASAELPSQIRAPAVSGVAMEGETLEAHGGTWTGEPPHSFTYDWQRCNNGGGDCVMIGVPQSKFYTLTAADIGFRVRAWVTVTGQDCGEWNYSNLTRECRAASVGAPSSQTEVVAPNPKFRPQSTAPPTISGTAEEGETLEAEDGGWGGLQPIATARQWERCDADGAGCAAIPAQAAETYTIAAQDVGKRIRVVVTAMNARGASPAVPSATTAVVLPLLPRAGRTAIDADQVSLPHRLVIDRFSFSPSPLRGRARVTARFRVSDTRGFRVRGALVRIEGVAGGLIAVVPAASTGEAGWATLRFRPSARVVFRSGASIELLVRAYRSGQSQLGGVSARKRVSLPLAAPLG